MPTSPERRAKTVGYAIDERNADDQYARLYADNVVDIVDRLRLPRYGLGNHVRERHERKGKAGRTWLPTWLRSKSRYATQASLTLASICYV